MPHTAGHLTEVGGGKSAGGDARREKCEDRHRGHQSLDEGGRCVRVRRHFRSSCWLYMLNEGGRDRVTRWSEMQGVMGPTHQAVAPKLLTTARRDFHLFDCNLPL